MGLLHVTWVRSFECLICRVGVVTALPAPIAWSCRQSHCLLLAVEHLMLLLLEHEMVYRRMRNRHQHCPLLVKDWKRICFANLILTLFLNLIILSNPHSGFKVALLLRWWLWINIIVKGWSLQACSYICDYSVVVKAKIQRPRPRPGPSRSRPRSWTVVVKNKDTNLFPRGQGLSSRTSSQWNCDKYASILKLNLWYPSKHFYEQTCHWKLLIGTHLQLSFIIRKWKNLLFLLFVSGFRTKWGGGEVRWGGSFWRRRKAHTRFLNTCALKLFRYIERFYTNRPNIANKGFSSEGSLRC